MTVKLIIVLVLVGALTNLAVGDVAQRIKNRYDNAVAKCTNSKGRDKPAYECSGILIRGVNNDLSLEFAWGMKDLNKEKDAFSVAYLRRDQVFSAFPRGYESGYIIYPHSKTPSNKNTYKIYCSFPMDAHADGREGHGCGKSLSDITEKSKHCRKQNIKTFDSWKTHFNEIMKSSDKNFVRRQCGFDMTVESAAKDFALSLKANRYLQSHSTKYAFRNNELRMHAWNEKNAQDLPIEAFFYLIGSKHGKDLAEKYQTEYRQKSGGEIVPIVGIRLPTANEVFKIKSG